DDPAVDDTAPDPDRLLPWPAPERVTEAWEKRRAALSAGTRRLLGRPLERAWLTQVLRDGHQRARASAAIELCAIEPGKPMIDVRAPGFRQRVL
ncbi:MAG: hypothetical protein ABI193_00940, partial [Minicystis sp.]